MMEKRLFFQGPKRDEPPSNEPSGGTIFKKQKIMIRPVMNLPKQNDAIKDSAEPAEVYDPFQLTNEELDKRVDDVYDPFEPTLSDNEVDISLDEVKSPEIEETSVFNKVETFQSKKSPPDSSLYELDIEQMLDSTYDESNKVLKADIVHRKFPNVNKQSKKLSSDFDIFAEEELEKAQAAAELPPDDTVQRSDSSSKTSLRFDNLSHKIKSAFAAESDPTVANFEKLETIDNTIASNVDDELTSGKSQSMEQSPNVGAEAILQAIDADSQNVTDINRDCEDDQDGVVNQDSGRINKNNLHSTNKQRSPSRSSSGKAMKQDPDQSKQSTSRNSSQSPSPKKRRSQSREEKRSETSSARKKRAYRKRSKSHSPSPEKSRTKSRHSRSRSRHRTSRKNRDRSHSRSRKDDRNTKKSRSRSRGRHYREKYHSRSRSPQGHNKKRKRSRSKHKSPSKNIDRSKSPKKSSKKIKKSRSRSPEKWSRSKSDRRKSSKRSSSRSDSRDAILKQLNKSEEAVLNLNKSHKHNEQNTTKKKDRRSQTPVDEDAHKNETKIKHSEVHEEKDIKKSFKDKVKDSKKNELSEESDLKKTKDCKTSEKHENRNAQSSSDVRCHESKKSFKESGQNFSEKHDGSSRRKFSKEEDKTSEKHDKTTKSKYSKEKNFQHDEKKEKADDLEASKKKLDDSGDLKTQKDSDKQHKIGKKNQSKEYEDSDRKHSKEKSFKHREKGHKEKDKSIEENASMVEEKLRKLKGSERKSSKNRSKYSDDEDETLLKSSKKKKKKKKYEDDNSEDEVTSSKKKKKHRKYDPASSGSEAKSVKKQKVETHDGDTYSDDDRISRKKKKKKRYTSSDKESDVDSNKHREGKSHKQFKKYKPDKKLKQSKNYSDFEDADSDLSPSFERKQHKKKHKKDVEGLQVHTNEDEAFAKKRKKKKRESRDAVDIYADLEDDIHELPTDLLKSSESACAVAQPKQIDAEGVGDITMTENTLQVQKVDEPFSKDDPLTEMHLLPSDKLCDTAENENFGTEHQRPKISEKEPLADTSQELDIDYLLEESLKNLPSAEESGSISNSRPIPEQIDDKGLRSPSPMSPSLLSPASSHPDDVTNSQNSSMIMSSHDFKETPSYAETFLEQSRKRWEKSYRNKSPHIPSTLTPDESSSCEVNKRDVQSTKPDIAELSSLSDIFVDPTLKTKLSSSEYTAAEISSVSADDIFKESSPRTANSESEQALHNASFESEIRLNFSESTEAARKNQLSKVDKLSQDTDLRVLLEQVKTESESVETGKDDSQSLLSTEQSKLDKGDVTPDKATKKRKRSASPKRRSSSPSPHRRHSERKRSERYRRSRSRERRSRYRRSPSRSPRRKRSYESRRRKDSSRDSRRDRNRSSERRRYSSEKAKRSQTVSDTAASETAPQTAAQPASELLNKFLEQTTAFIPLLQEQQQQVQLEVKKAPETNVSTGPTSPQPIATISGISSAVFPHGTSIDAVHNVTDELGHPHDMMTNTFPNLVNESRPALIQIPTIDSHTSELNTKKEETIEKKDSPKKAEGIACRLLVF